MRKSPPKLDSPPHLSLTLFGPPQLKNHQERLQFKRDKTMALLSYLLVKQTACPRATLAVLLWPNSRQALALLRTSLSDLRSVCGNEVLVSQGPVLSLAPDQLACDVVRFRQLIAEAAAHAHAAPPAGLASPCSTCQRLLVEAVALVKEDFMTGFMLSDSNAFHEWQTQQAQQLHREYLSALKNLVQLFLQQRDFANAQQYATRWVTAEPFEEQAHRFLMKAFALGGQRDLALDQYRTYKTALNQEFGLPPQEETTALYQAIFSGIFPIEEPGLAPPGPPGMSKDGNTAQGQSFLTPAIPTIFPVPPTSFCGRMEETAYLVARLQAPDCRLVTLLGMGGSGKTRLALEVARTLAEDRHTLQACFPAGLYFVAGEGLTHRTQLLNELVDTLVFPHPPQESQEAQIIQGLKGKRLLLILDNFEHLATEAPFLSRLLAALPELKILVTSRERLALQEEECLNVYGLDYPCAEAKKNQPLGAYGAVRLFLERAWRVQPNFALDLANARWVIQICQMLEGLPLGLELATEQLRYFSVQEVAERLTDHRSHLQTSARNLPPRHVSLRAIFDYSWAGLTADEQAAYARLSVFSGGFTGPAAQAVEVSQTILFSLLDKSLLEKRQGDKFALHPVLKQLAAEKLSADPDTFPEAFYAFTRYYLRFLAQASVSLQTNEPHTCLASLTAEIENIRFAWALALTFGWFEMVEEALESYYAYYRLHHLYHEGALAFQLSAQMLAAEDTPALKRLHGKMRNRQGRFLVALGQIKEAQTCFEEALQRADEPE